MATGRTLARWSQVFLNGVTYCSLIRSVGPLVSDYSPSDDEPAMCDEVRGGFPEQARLTPTATNGLLVAGTSEFYGFPYVGTSKVVTVNIGIRTTPAAGDESFSGQWYVTGGTGDISNGMVPFNLMFGDWDAANLVNYQKAWGKILHAYGAETAANSATGGVDNGAATTAGGYFVYQCYSINDVGVILSVEDSADDSSYSALSGAVSPEINSTPTAGIVALGTTATVRRYLRWQIDMGSATSVVFTCSFVRG